MRLVSNEQESPHAVWIVPDDEEEKGEHALGAAMTLVAFGEASVAAVRGRLAGIP